jgi:molecular chaperone GrpE
MSPKRQHPDQPEPVVIRDKRRIDRSAAATEAADAVTESARADQAAEAAEAAVPKAQALLLEERTRDLQRIQAEYANYRKRADRDRLAAGDVAVGRVLAELLPVLDDIERARNHGDLTGALKAVSDHLDSIFGKLGLESFGAEGDPFDPAIHEAVMHGVSSEVTEPTCTKILRPGYRYKDRLLRAAMVGVSDPEPSPAPADAESEAAGEDEAEGASE